MLAKLEANPKAVPPAALKSILEAFGYAMRPAKGSHRAFIKPGQRPLVVPFKRPHVKQFYVEEVIARLRAELGEEG